MVREAGWVCVRRRDQAVLDGDDTIGEGGEAGVVSVSLFWHFVDVIWILLFVLLYVWQR